MAGNTTAAAQAALSACESFCATDAQCHACSVDCPSNSPSFPHGVCQWAALPACGKVDQWGGLISGDISLKQAQGQATITLQGPAAGWFGVGFNAQHMADSPYAIIVSGADVDKLDIMERQLGTGGSEARHDPGDLLAPSVTLVSAKDEGGVRTVVLTRALLGKTSKHYTFKLAEPTIKFISAIGSTPTFAYHKAHAAAAITLTAANGTPTCLCDAGPQGALCENGGHNCDSFVRDCNDQPGGLLQQANPTCNSRTYGGGLRCCSNMRTMLDEDQDGGSTKLRYHMKYRFWFQAYEPSGAAKPAPHQISPSASASHNNLPRYYWQTESNAGEYDIPPAFAREGETIVGYNGWPVGKPLPGTTCTGKCPDGPDCECQHRIQYTWESPGMRLLYAGAHCHAPSCLGMRLYRNATKDGKSGDLICDVKPGYGKGQVHLDKYAGLFVLKRSSAAAMDLCTGHARVQHERTRTRARTRSGTTKRVTSSSPPACGAAAKVAAPATETISCLPSSSPRGS
jgi:hypothetical protein